MSILSELNYTDINDFKKEELISLLNCEKSDILELMSLASRKKNINNITYSKNVFLPLTEICKNDCGYCGFKKSPDETDAIILKKKEETLKTVKEGEKYNCKEALLTFGEDADEEEIVQNHLDKLGYSNMLEYTYDTCQSILNETKLLPHTNCGNIPYKNMKKLKEVNVSMGMMLENSSERLMKTIAHKKSPGKNPKLRLKTISNAGKLKIPYTTGILIGIGETKEEIIDSLLEIKKIQNKYGHIQEIIIQNFRVSPGIEMENYKEPELLDIIRTVSLGKLLFDDVSIQVPPNLNYETAQTFLLCGADDWGGVSPITEDYVNPTSPWPTLDHLKNLTNNAGFNLKERLAVYKKYINSDYLDENVLPKAKSLQNEIEN